ncbi:disulfide bond formation protein DsbB [Alishewanella sp. SMS8]|uniref:disulfide bond formation protein DsbB n=1 Tax=unclassified Alishewanella TaxID=2628974 RepID=UPI002740C491|nr:disulfide bond formation protein DsbB [Alishewanella sp. SMS8]MDP4943980.1 disulfide bond formation protein DsbB [Alishewanella sp.]MDP5036070.1 disulfide bond formation protein DsbB [Alishewanella sp.]MDP5185728.1 disulfide bond formation protein DsbB [Alishewanella sp.]MDP5458104.1 disulfide bond formation protein DsbB [Alishewanella sp. SMS8]
MFQALKSLSLKRWPWLLLAFTALLFEASGLYFQYVLNFQPCIKCIYIRAAFLGILVAGLIGAFAPRHPLGRFVANLAWLGAALYGFWQAQELVAIEQTLASGGFTTCALFADFPSWLALDRWFPAVFEVTGTCGGVSWQFASLSMAQWSRIIMFSYSVVSVVVLASQFSRLNKNPYRD